MRRSIYVVMLLAACVWMSACGAAGTNTAPANATNTNTAKPTAAAPTADTFMALEREANQAYAKGDGAYFEGMLSDKAVMSMGKDRMGKTAIVDMIKTAKCEGVEVKLSEPQMSKINDDTYAFTYKNDSTGKCSEGGKMMEMKPVRSSTIWVRNGEKWQAAWHGENVLVDPKAAAPEAEKKEEKPDTEKKEVAKADEPKKDEAKPADKPAATAADAKPEAPKPSANTDALVKLHQGGWEAFKNKDAKTFDGAIASTFAFVDPIGGYHGSKADAIKLWTETMKCEGITKTSVTDGFATALSPTVEMLFAKGSSDGTCDGMKNGDLWQTSVYVKEGDAWKLTYMFESLPQPAM